MVHLYYLPRGHVFQLTDVGLVLSFPIHFGHAQTIRATDYEVEFNGCGTWEYLGP